MSVRRGKDAQNYNFIGMIFRITLVITAMVFGFGIMDTVYAQISVGDAPQKNIDVFIEDDGKIHVIHHIGDDDSPRSLTLIEGTASNIKVSDEEGNEVQSAITGGFGNTLVTIFPTRDDTFVSYDLEDVMFKKHNTTWTWHFLYSRTTTFHMPDSVDLVFVNDRPIYLKDGENINCHGCDMVLEFIPDEKKITQQISWEDKEFDVEIWASTDITELSLDQPAKNISYVFDDSERWVTLIIPLELLWNPYQAWLDDEKIFTHEFGVDEKHRGISLKLKEAGTVSIIGTSVVPEFSAIIPIMLVMISAVLLLQFRSRIILR